MVGMKQTLFATILATVVTTLLAAAQPEKVIVYAVQVPVHALVQQGVPSIYANDIVQVWTHKQGPGAVLLDINLSYVSSKGIETQTKQHKATDPTSVIVFELPAGAVNNITVNVEVYRKIDSRQYDF